MPKIRRKPSWQSAVLLIISTSLLLPGCDSADDSVIPPVVAAFNSTVTIVDEPEFTAGSQNEISWVLDEGAAKGADGLSYQVEVSTDATFVDSVTASPWVEVTNHIFTDLVEGQALYYRVMARNQDARTSPWSPSASSTQDRSAPAATVIAFEEDETSLLFDVEVTAEDLISGVANINLWFRKNAEEWQLHGPVEVGITSFQTDEGGPHEFMAVATDVVGNEQEMPTDAQATTLVPEQIILIDGLGDEWDVTNAVLKHLIHLDFWAHGLGRNTIKPIIDPQMAYEGHAQFPDPNSQADGMGVNYDGDQRFYPINDLISREVANDVVNGAPIAVTY